MRDDWLDLRLCGWHKLDVQSIRPEVWRHFDLVYVACDHRSNGREGLKRFAIGICRPRRVHDHTVASLEPSQRCPLSLVQLYEASLDPDVHVIPRRDADPEAARAGPPEPIHVSHGALPLNAGFALSGAVLKSGPRARPRTESDRSWRSRRRASCAGEHPDCEASLRTLRESATVHS